MSTGGKKKPKEVPSEKTILVNPITHHKTIMGVYPSNAQMWWMFKRPPEVGTDRPPKQYLEVFDPSLIYQLTIGNAPAPKGHYIMPALQQDRSAVSGVPGLPVIGSGINRPRAVAFFAGRVFYAGTNVAGFNTKVYFSQILERPAQIQECYQANDPTDEELRDLLPSDGGVIVIPEISEIYHIHAMGQALFIFARNGVWQLTGSEGIGFRANDYSVSKISGIPAISSMSFVDVEGAPLWWNRSGIYTLAQDKLGNGTTQSLTDDSIKAFFNTIPVENKEYAKAAYDPLKQRVQWLYRTKEAVTQTDFYDYDTILNLDTRTGAFYVHTPAQGRTVMKGLFAIEGWQIQQNVEAVVVDEDEVFVDTDIVEAVTEERKPVQTKMTYIVDLLDEEEIAGGDPGKGIQV